MNSRQKSRVLGAMFLTATMAHLSAQTRQSPSSQQLPNAPGKETVQKLCGTCHSANMVLGRGLTRDEWNEVVVSMITRGAKGTQAEFTQVTDYLAKNLPPKSAPGGPSPATGRPRGGGGFTMGPDNKQIVDSAGMERGKVLYNAQCVTCHGKDARGQADGHDLVRSLTVLHDRYGSTLGPFLRKDHPAVNGKTISVSNDAQIKDLSHYLHQQVNDTLRSGPYSKVLNVLTGDPKAGAAYFNGPGGCKGCHSETGDLAGIASKYNPPALQQRLLFPGTITTGRITATVTPPDGPPVSGVLDKIDDFSVSLRDASGEYHSWKRTADLKVEKKDPFAGHYKLLDQYTDKDVHDLVAYLETLK